jgi:sugar phosphate permease
VALVNWFRRRRALALGVSATGMAAGGLLTQVVALALASVGWRWTAAASGLVILAAGLPLARLVRHRPEPYGLTPDGDPPPSEAARGAGPAGRARAPGPPAARDFTAREAMRTPAFWLISLGHGSALLVVSAVIVHMVVHVTERLGYSLRQGTAVVALLTTLQMAGQLLGGWAGDRGPLMAAMRADYFGSASYGMIAGISSTVVMLGMMAGPLVAGVLADRTGSYVAGFRVLAALAALGSVFFLLAHRPPPPRA